MVAPLLKPVSQPWCYKHCTQVCESVCGLKNLEINKWGLGGQIKKIWEWG